MDNPFYSFGRWVRSGIQRLVGVQTPQVANDDSTATPVTFETAMQLSAVWACVKLLAETVASLPLTVYRGKGPGRTAASTHWLQVLMAGKVNQYQTRVEFFETVLLNLVMTGNAYCHVLRDADGDIVGLMPLMSAQMRVELLSNGSVVYVHTQGADVTVLASASVWHLKLMGNGIVGMSVLDYQRHTLGIAQGAEKAVSRIYRNGGKPSGVLKLDRLLTKDQRAEARASFNTLTTGNDERLLVLEKGSDFEAISMSPQDIELLSSRKFQIAEICRWYGVPSVMVNDNAGTSTWGSGIAQIVEGFYKVTLRPLIEKIENSADVHLLGDDRFTHEVEFDLDALLRGDMKSRFEAFRVAIASALMTPNEARAAEKLPPAEGGQQLFIQGAMVPISQAGQARAPQPAAGDPNVD